MPNKPKIHTFETFAGQDVSLLARIRLLDGSLASQASIDSINVTVSKADGTKTIDNEVVAVSDVVSDSTRGSNYTDPRWTIDDIGFNFIHAISGESAFPDRDFYRVEYTFTQADDSQFKLVFEGPARSSNG